MYYIDWETTKHALSNLMKAVWFKNRGHLALDLKSEVGEVVRCPSSFRAHWIIIKYTHSIDEGHISAMAKMEKNGDPQQELVCAICEVRITSWLKCLDGINFLYRLRPRPLPSSLRAASANKRPQFSDQIENTAATVATCTCLRRNGWRTTTRERSTAGWRSGWSCCCRFSGSSRLQKRSCRDQMFRLCSFVLFVSKGFGLLTNTGKEYGL